MTTINQILRAEQLEAILPNANLSVDSQDLEVFKEQYAKEIVEYCDNVDDLTGVLSVLFEEPTQVWVTCWRRPYDAHTEYTRIV